MTTAAPAMTRSIQRALQLLGAFTPDHPNLTLTDLARRAGVPLTTVHRLAGDLLAWGALERDGSGRYRIGLRLWEVASLAPRGLGLREAALPFLEDLTFSTRQNVQLAVRDGEEVVVVERLTGRAVVAVHTRVGGRLPLHASGVGLVLLAFAPAPYQERVLSRKLERFTPATCVRSTELRRVLAVVRQQGFVVTESQLSASTVSVGAPVFGPKGDVVAAVSVVAHSGDALPAALVPAVRTAARGISRALGQSVPRAIEGGGMLKRSCLRVG